MRKIINISLPEDLAKKVEAAVKKGDYASKSEFFRNLIRIWDEEEVLKEIRKSHTEINAGKGKFLRSLKYLR
jgi:Arc/MetJ-type ribon-helix-helix transcriptional regulator